MAPLEPAALLEQALRLPSPSGQEQAVARFLAERSAEFADEAFVDEAGNVVAVVGGGPVAVTFLGHIDTYPGGPAVRREGDLLFGRGAVDAKGPFCVALAAASRLGAATRERLTLRLIGATEEEAPSSRGAHFAVATYPAPDYLVIGEPSGWQGITLGYKGRLTLELSVVKDTGHSAGEEPSASDDVLASLRCLEELVSGLNEEVSRTFESLQWTVRAIASHEDGLQQSCRATVVFRLPPSLAPAELIGRVGRSLPDSVGRSFSGATPAVVAGRDNVLTRSFRNAIRESGGSPRHKYKTGTSDMNVAAPVWRVPVLAYGPGDSSLDHTPGEHVSVAELERATGVLVKVFESLAAA